MLIPTFCCMFAKTTLIPTTFYMFAKITRIPQVLIARMFVIFIRAVLVASHFEVAMLRTRKGDSRKGRFLIVMLCPKPR